MPNLVSSKKDVRRIKRRSKFNDRLRNRVKKAVKSFNSHLTQNDSKKATQALTQVNKVMGKASKRNVLAKKTASRSISRLTKKLNNLITANNVETAKKSS